MTQVTWELLNAYVDNELDADMAAEVAAAIAEHPALAARAATLTRLKATVAKSQPDESTIAFPAVSRGHSPRRAIWRVAAAACFCASVSAAGLWFGAPLLRSEQTGSDLSAGLTWLASPPNDKVSEISIVAAGSRAAPDLSAADLRITYVAVPLDPGRAGGLFVGYTGNHGCRLGLWIGRTEDMPMTSPSFFKEQRSPLQTHSWSSDKRGFLLASRGMDQQRFDRYAAIIKELTIRGPGLTNSVAVALAEAGRTGKACEG